MSVELIKNLEEKEEGKWHYAVQEGFILSRKDGTSTEANVASNIACHTRSYFFVFSSSCQLKEMVNQKSPQHW